MEQSLTVVVAEVDALTVEYLSDLLERHGFRARIAPPVHDAVRDWVRKYHADLCLIDSSLRDGDDLGEITALRAAAPDTGIVIRTADNSSQRMRDALDAGAAGYLHKSRGPVVVVEVLRRVAEGEVVVEGSFSMPAASGPADDGRGESLRLVESLTPRQLECLELLAEGKGTIAIADELGVSVMTIRSHIQALLGRLGVRSRLEAASILMRRNASV